MNRTKFSMIISLAAAAFAIAQSCAKQEVEVFSGSERYVYFKRYIKDKDGKSVRVDTSMMSFSHYYGVTEFTQDYYLGLVGQVPEKDLTYEVQIVEDGTTATPDQYSLPEKFVFRKGQRRSCRLKYTRTKLRKETKRSSSCAWWTAMT